MEAIFILVPLSLGIIFLALGVFVWSVYNGQYDDLEKEAERILMDDDDSQSGDLN